MHFFLGTNLVTKHEDEHDAQFEREILEVDVVEEVSEEDKKKYSNNAWLWELSRPERIYLLPGRWVCIFRCNLCMYMYEYVLVTAYACSFIYCNYNIYIILILLLLLFLSFTFITFIYIFLGTLGAAIVGISFPLLGYFLAEIILVFYLTDPVQVRGQVKYFFYQIIILVVMFLFFFLGFFNLSFCRWFCTVFYTYKYL